MSFTLSFCAACHSLSIVFPEGTSGPKVNILDDLHSNHTSSVLFTEAPTVHLSTLIDQIQEFAQEKISAGTANIAISKEKEPPQFSVLQVENWSHKCGGSFANIFPFPKR